MELVQVDIMKKEVKIAFVDFAPDFDRNNNDFISILSERYNVVVDSKDPDYLFYSNFGNSYLKYDCVRIFYTGECITPDFNLCDYAMAFDRISFGDRYLRMPLYRLFQYRKQYDKLFEREEIGEIDVNKRFCSFVVSNCFAEDIRAKMFNALSEYKQVSSGGRYLNNVGGPIKDKYEFQTNHKFAIAFENQQHDGYATEKLVDALAARTVPIYLGDPNIHTDLNEESFINGNRYNSLEELVERVKEVDQNDELYLQILNANPILEDRRNNDDLRTFLFNIFDQEYSNAGRRSKMHYAKEHEKFLKRYSTFDKYTYKKYKRIKNILYRITHKAI